MSQPRVETVADEIIAADAARAATESRAGKVSDEPRRVEERGGGTPWWIFLGGGAALLLLIVIGGSALGLFGGQPGESPTASHPGVGGATPTPGAAQCSATAALRELFADGLPGSGNLCDALVADGSGDLVEYDGSPATVKVPNIDLIGTGLLSITVSAEQATSLAARCGTGGLHCGATPPSAGNYTLFAIELGAPVMQLSDAFWEAGIGYLDASPAGGGEAKAWAAQPADVLRGHNTVYTLRFPSSEQPVVGPFRLFYLGQGDQNFFQDEPTGAFVWASGSVLVGFIPAAESDGAQEYRFFSYYTKNDNSASAVDEAPNFDLPAVPVPDS